VRLSIADLAGWVLESNQIFEIGRSHDRVPERNAKGVQFEEGGSQVTLRIYWLFPERTINSSIQMVWRVGCEGCLLLPAPRE
jgi:hypothetical protein